MSITRVQYRERQTLTTADLRWEQDYRLGMGGRHHLAHHDRGIVRGLRVTERNGVFELTPGVAIDGYGRELLVPITVELDALAGDGPWSLLLYYCEDPEQTPPGRPCKDDPAPRIRQRTAWRLTSRFEMAAMSATDLGRARAAGRMASLPPWPVLVADIDAPPSINYARATYVAHRAALIRSPTQRALGLSGRTDVYHFLVSTPGADAALGRRIGIDRDRTFHVWGPLVIAGTTAYGTVTIARNLVLQITTPLPAGPGRRVRIDGQFGGDLKRLSASLIDLGAGVTSPFPFPLQPVPLTKPSVELATGDGRGVLFELFDLTKRQPITFSAAHRRLVRARRRLAAEATDQEESESAPPASFSTELKPTGGKLVLHRLDGPSEVPEAVICGEIDRARPGNREAGTPVVQFKPANGIEADPLAREIHAVTTSQPTDAVPATALRLSGGGADDSDTANRISIGGQINKQYKPAVSMDGGRRLRIVATTKPPNEPLLDVRGTVYLPPIGRNDPMLPDLLALAFIGGLRRIGNITTNPKLELAPASGPAASVVRGQPLAYKLKISWASTFTLKRTFEIITGQNQQGATSLGAIYIEGIPAAGQTKTLTCTGSRFTRPESLVELQVLMLVKVGNLTRVSVSDRLLVNVQDPP